MIRFIKLILAQISLMAEHAWKVLADMFTAIFSVLFGRIAWQEPVWLRNAGACIGSVVLWCKKHIRVAISGLIVLVILIAAGIYGHYWYASQPKPYMVGYTFTGPRLNNAEMTIRFRDSVAPLEMVNQVVESGITIMPEIAGNWHWANGSTLQFKPRSAWPIDKAYKITLAEENLLKTGALLEKYQIEFTTPRFEIQNITSRLYQDPVEPDQKKIVATLTFSHPPDRDRLEALVSFELSKGLKYLENMPTAPEFFYSDNGREAYIHSALLETPLENSLVKLFIDKGVGAKAGGNKTIQAYTSEVGIPGLYQLTFHSDQIFFVDNEKGEPEPVFAFESSHTVADDAVKNQVTAWLLPERDDKGNRWGTQSVTEKALMQSPKVELTHIDSDNPQNTMHAFKFKEPPGRQLYVKVNGGVKATGGYIARSPRAFLLTMPEYPQELGFLSNGALLNLNGGKDLGIIARGVPGAQVEISRLLPRQLHLLVNQLDGNFTRPHMSQYALDQLVERHQIKIPIAADDPAKTIYTHVNLAPYLDDASAPQGIFVLNLGVYDPQ